MTVTVPTDTADKYFHPYVLITTPNAPEQEVAFAHAWVLLGGDGFPSPRPNGPTVTFSVNVCTDKLTAGYGPYTLRFAATSGDRTLMKAIYDSPAKERATAVANATKSDITFNNGTAPAAPHATKKITCKKKSSGTLRKFARTKCPAGWTRVNR